MPNIINVFRGLDILKKHLGNDHVRTDDYTIYAGGNGSASQIDLTEVEVAMLENAGWQLDPKFNCWVIFC